MSATIPSTDTIGSAVERVASAHPDSCAVVCGATRLSFADLAERCRRLAGGLRDLGLRPGDRVAVIADNCHRYLELYLAVPAAGMVLVPLNARLTPAEWSYALDDSDTRVLFTDRKPAAELSSVTAVTLDGEYENLLASAQQREPASGSSDALCGLFYTSGTTGNAKGVMLSQANLFANAATWHAVWPFDEAMRWTLIAPMFHLAGTNAVLATLEGGGRHIVLPSFDAAEALDLISRERATATLVVPTMLSAMAEEQVARPRDVWSLRHLSHGGAPIASETLRRAHGAFPEAELMDIYGTTETSPNITFLRHEEELLATPRVRSSGRAVKGAEIAVADTSGTRVGPGEIGEVIVRGPMVMCGYWNRPEATAAALKDRWYWTGDLGHLDPEGYLYLVDRLKDMIITGGENVYSIEVEEVLFRHPKVLEAAVFGVPDERWGEAVHAVICPREPIDDVTELMDHCRAQMAPFKVPKTIEIMADGLPKSGAGKILKRELRARFWNDRAEQIAGA